MAKLVKVVKETVVTYKVDGNCTDEEAITIVKKRIEAEAPLDIIDKSETIKRFTVVDV